MKSINFRTKDGCALSGTLYEPTAVVGASEVQPAGAVLLVCAMGVPQTFYRSFCEWLAQHGLVVMTFDYRGMGQSRTTALRRVEATVLTWAEQDAASALEHLAAVAPRVPITWLGHSLGGQIFAFTMDCVDQQVAARVRKFTYIAAGSGYWLENAPPTKRRSWIFWFVLGPLLTPLFGYWPGARLGIVGDLPKGVFYQWKAWCMNREYAVGVLPEKYRRLASDIKVPVTAISFTDDEMMSEENIKSLMAIYPQKAMRGLRYAPKELNVARIGHFGAFRKEMRAPLWEPVILAEIERA